MGCGGVGLTVGEGFGWIGIGGLHNSRFLILGCQRDTLSCTWKLACF